MNEPFASLSEGTKHFLDNVSLAATLGTLTSMLPPLAAALSIAWSLLRFYEWFKKRNETEAD